MQLHPRLQPDLVITTFLRKMMDRVYADYNATTLTLCSDVIDAMIKFKPMMGNLDMGIILVDNASAL